MCSLMIDETSLNAELSAAYFARLKGLTKILRMMVHHRLWPSAIGAFLSFIDSLCFVIICSFSDEAVQLS